MRSSPLSAWLVACVLILPIPASALLLDRFPGPSRSIEADNMRALQRLFEKTSAARARPRGVMLAMSGGMCATEGDLALAPDGAELVVLYHSSAAVEDFSGLIDSIVDAEPDFIVIQDTVLTRPPRHELGQLYRSVRALWRQVALAVARSLSGRESADAVGVRCRARIMRTERWESMMEQRARISSFRETNRVAVVADVLNQLFTVAPILVVSPPYSTYAVSYRQNVLETAQAIVEAARVPRELTWHSQPEPMPASTFADPLHMRPAFNEPYRHWLNAEILGVIEGSSD